MSDLATMVDNEEDSSSIADIKSYRSVVKRNEVLSNEPSAEVLTEAHRTQLLKQAQSITQEKKLAVHKSLELNHVLFDYLKIKGINSHHDEKNWDPVAKYHQVLERFYKVFKQNELMNEKITERTKNISQEKQKAVNEMNRLRNGEVEKDI